MTVILSGGGSGGHITPILAVAKSIKKLSPETRIIYIGQTGDHLSDIPKTSSFIDEIYSVRAGKYRRYYGEGLKQLLDIKTLLLNTRDFVYVIIGILQSTALIRRLKPDIVFTRGGFVSVPVALGAKINGVPFLTHDSDSVPSLANRIIARWATKNLVAMDVSLYPYPEAKVIRTGIPVSDNFIPVTDELKRKYKKELGYKTNDQLLFVIGGGLGSRNINNAVIKASNELLDLNKKLKIAHVAGRQNQVEVTDKYNKALTTDQHNRVKILDFISNVEQFSGAADLVVARAGATNIAEFAIQGKACIIIPSGFLVSGHQLKNSLELEKAKAAVVIDERKLLNDPDSFTKTIIDLINDPDKRQSLALNISKLAMPNSSDNIAEIILSEDKKK